ncbi:MAG: hypothetical protein H6774_01165 [Pseudomonadales bacterium]|nr:hypothetical protein [Candidatus Woesebacteria bacterium]MCB9801676.1 hypothetical protein [Pseudomonadales bacterium]
MILTEHEAKQLLAAAQIAVSRSVLITKEQFEDALYFETTSHLQFPAFAKAQVLHGNRALSGLIQKVETAQQLDDVLTNLFSLSDQNKQPVTSILLEEAIEHDAQHYLSVSYSTRERSVVMQYSDAGGVGMDERGGEMQTHILSILTPPTSFPLNPELLPLVQQLWHVFTQHDATLVEINPLVQNNGEWVCLDAKIELDSVAAFRHSEWSAYPARTTAGAPPTEREQKAKAVSRSDHRGVAGESFLEFPGGEVGIMASGGGASLLVMDALLLVGIKPANYTEYSGNPTREKVHQLTEVVLSIPRLNALFVVGSNANFTDIYETLAGVVDGFLASAYASQEGFIILIRRGGPRWQEAFEMVRERLADRSVILELLGPDAPVTSTAGILKELLEQQAKKKV